MLDFWKTSARLGDRLGILSAAFNPPTLAHLEMARSAAPLDEVLFLLPRAFPHKPYTGAGFEDRLDMLSAALADQPQFSIGSTDGGLFIEIARECRPVYGPAADFFFLCGRDAAERIVNWDYSGDIPFGEQLREFQMLVAPRSGPYLPPPALADRIHRLDLPRGLEACSSSAVRDSIAQGRDWRHLVPVPVAELIHRRHLYDPRP